MFSFIDGLVGTLSPHHLLHTSFPTKALPHERILASWPLATQMLARHVHLLGRYYRPCPPCPEPFCALPPPTPAPPSVSKLVFVALSCTRTFRSACPSCWVLICVVSQWWSIVCRLSSVWSYILAKTFEVCIVHADTILCHALLPQFSPSLQDLPYRSAHVV
jgi:hypothetical protein